MVRCERWYTDGYGRTVYVVCPICTNGDPQSDQDDCGLTDDQLEENLIFLVFIKGIYIDGVRPAGLYDVLRDI